jgi:hypothetical protein
MSLAKGLPRVPTKHYYLNFKFAGPGRQPGYFLCKAPKKVSKEMAWRAPTHWREEEMALRDVAANVE